MCCSSPCSEVDIFLFPGPSATNGEILQTHSVKVTFFYRVFGAIKKPKMHKHASLMLRMRPGFKPIGRSELFAQ
jgi:hypothetical protein